MTRSLTLALLIPLVACGDQDGPAMDFGGEDLGPDRHVVLSEDSDAKMGLTDRYVYFGLSDESLDEARSELDAELGDREGLGGMIGGMVGTAVGKALGFRAAFPIEEIRDIRWENGAMRIVFTDPDRDLGDNFKINEEPLTEVFTEDAVLEFAAAFRAVKAERETDGQ